MSSFVWNLTLGKDQFFKCNRLQTNFPEAFEEMIRLEADEAAAEAEIARKEREKVMLSPQTGLTMTKNEKYTDRERIDRFLGSLKKQKQQRLDRQYADAMINDALPFTLWFVPT